MSDEDQGLTYSKFGSRCVEWNANLGYLQISTSPNAGTLMQAGYSSGVSVTTINFASLASDMPSEARVGRHARIPAADLLRNYAHVVSSHIGFNSSNRQDSFI